MSVMSIFALVFASCTTPSTNNGAYIMGVGNTINHGCCEKKDGCKKTCNKAIVVAEKKVTKKPCPPKKQEIKKVVPKKPCPKPAPKKEITKEDAKKTITEAPPRKKEEPYADGKFPEVPKDEYYCIRAGKFMPK